MSELKVPVISDKLDSSGSNWMQWRGSMLASARAMRITGYLDGSIPKPSTSAVTVTLTPPSGSSTPPASSTTSPKPTKSHPSSSTPTLTEWEDRDAVAFAMIWQNVKTPISLGLRDTDTAAQAWQKLLARMQQKSDLAYYLVRQELGNLRYRDGTSLSAHLEELERLRYTCGEMGVEVQDGEFKQIIFGSMPESWDGIIRQLVLIPDPTSIITTLLAEDRRIAARRELPRASTSSGTALATRTPNPNQNIAVTCSNPMCTSKTKNHPIEQCFSPGGGKAGQYPEWYKKKFPNKVAQAQRANVASSAAKPSSLVDLDNLSPDDMARLTKLVETAKISKLVDQAGVALMTQLRRPRGSDHKYFADSGATCHMSSQRSDFIEYTEIPGGAPIHPYGSGTSGAALTAAGTGTIQRCVSFEGSHRLITFRDVLYVPGGDATLLSLSRITAGGVRIALEGAMAIFKDAKDTPFMSARVVNGLYELDLLDPANHATDLAVYALSTRANTTTIAPINAIPKGIAMVAHTGASFDTWHRRLGHLSDSGLTKMANSDAVNGLVMTSKKPSGDCEDCLLGKAARAPFTNSPVESAPLERVYMDLWGPARVASNGGKRYACHIKDGHSGHLYTSFLSHKDETALVIAVYHAMAERSTGQKLKKIRTDGGSEFVNKIVRTYCDAHGIQHETSAPYTPQEVGVAERVNRTVMEHARCLLFDSGLPQNMWAEAVSTTVYLLNRTPTTRANGKTPYELWHGSKPDISHLRVFGCTAFAKIPTEKRSKLGPQTVKCVLLGYQGSSIYRLYDPDTRTVFVSRDVRFIESEPHRIVAGTEGERNFIQVRAGEDELEEDELEEDELEEDEGEPTGPKEANGSGLVPAREAPGVPATVQTTARRPRDVPDPSLIVEGRRNRTASSIRKDHEAWVENEAAAKRERQEIARRRAEKRGAPIMDEDNLALAVHVGSAPLADIKIPRSFKEAMKQPDVWLPVMDVEMKGLREKGVFELVELPEGKNLMGSIWIFDAKLNSLGKIDRLKARLVADGRTQIPGVDFNETYAAVVRFDSLRMMLAIAAVEDLEIWQIDFEQAFLNAPLEEEVYMRQPPGFIEPGKEKCVWRLLKSLYGTMQGAYAWYQTLESSYKGLGYNRSPVDHCVRRRADDKGETITCTYTDDVTGVSSTIAEAGRAKAELGEDYKIKDLGELEYLLGIKVERNRPQRTITLSQKAYASRVLARFNMEDAHPVSTPLPHGTEYSRAQCPTTAEEKGEMAKVPYREAIGAMMYMAVATRPDIAFAVQKLSCFSQNPGRDHWNGVKHLLRYIKGTSDYCLVYGGPGATKNILAFADADYAGCVDTSRSTSGYVFTMAGGAVSWSAKRQSVVTLSSTEAEYVALSHCAQQAMWSRELMKSMGREVAGEAIPMLIRGDNMGSLSLAKNPTNHPRTKHIRVKFHYVRERVAEGEITVKYIHTSENLADGLTKALPRIKHLDFVARIGLRRNEGEC